MMPLVLTIGEGGCTCEHYSKLLRSCQDRGDVSCSRKQQIIKILCVYVCLCLINPLVSIKQVMGNFCFSLLSPSNQVIYIVRPSIQQFEMWTRCQLQRVNATPLVGLPRKRDMLGLTRYQASEQNTLLIAWKFIKSLV